MKHFVVRDGSAMRVRRDSEGQAHRHTDAEEIYVVLSGSGRAKLGDELFRVPLTGAAIWTVREAKVVRAEFYADRSEGLAAAGLAE